MAILVRHLWKRHLWLLGFLCLGICGGAQANQGSVVPLTLNGLTVRNVLGQSGWGGFGTFTYDGINVSGSSTLGQYDSFVVDSINSTGGGSRGSGVGWNVAINNEAPVDLLTGTLLDITEADFPVFDRAGYGTNFNPDNYKIEVVYKPLPGNEASVFNVLMDTYDGFRIEDREGFPGFGQGKRYAEQHQWGFGYEEQGLGTIQEYYDANPKDADGFVTISAPLTDGTGGVSDFHIFNGPSWMFASGSQTFQALHTIPGDGLPDFDAFEDLVPNGVVQLHLQSAYSQEYPERLHMEVKRISVVPINPDPTEVARLDAWSGVGRRFGTPFSTETSPDGVTPVDNPIIHRGTEMIIRPLDQLQRFDQDGFTNLIIKTDDDDMLGGFGIWQDPHMQRFDGNEATLEVRARLTAPLDGTRASRFDVVLNDLDGNDTGPGTGGEEYKYFIDLDHFNTSTFTTLSIPLTDFDERNQAFELVNSGDESLSDFRLYYMGVLTLPDEGLVDVEIEYIRIVVPPEGLPGDYNENGVVDAADYVVWRDNLGSATSLPNDDTPGVGIDDYARWKSNFGNVAAGSGAMAGGAAVPEPATWTLLLMALGLLAGARRRVP